MTDVATAPNAPTTLDSELFPRHPAGTGDSAGGSRSQGAAPTRVSSRRQTGPNWTAIILAALCVALFLWGAWITKAVTDLRADKAPFVSVRLQPLIEEYVQAQARTSSPESQVTQETQAFMAALDAELRARGEAGRTVVVAEAVLSKNVPDVTDDVRKAVYAKVPAPGAGLASAIPAGGLSSGLGQ